MASKNEIIEILAGDKCCLCLKKFTDEDAPLELKVIEEYFYDKPWGMNMKRIYFHKKCVEDFRMEQRQ